MISTAGSRNVRLAVDDVLDVLSRTDDRELTEIVELLASICHVSAAGITIRRGDEYHVPITHGIEPLVCSSEETFCRVTMDTDGVYVVQDSLADPRFRHLGFAEGRFAHARFYASAPIHSPSGAMVGRLCMIDDSPRRLADIEIRALETLAGNVTDLIELRLLRNRQRAVVPVSRAQDATTIVAQLSAELAHDLRVPLTAIAASLEMTREQLGELGDPVVEDLLTRAESATQRMGRMLDTSLDRSVQTVTPHRADLGGIARQLVTDSAALVQPLGAVIELGDLPVVQADADAMYSVFQNLVSNAIKFARPDVPARVLITSRRVRDGWRVAVLDNGVGIPAERRVDVFSLFSRVHEGVEGHGIGLATVARIITAHGGRVGASEAPGGGSEIWFELPPAH